MKAAILKIRHFVESEDGPTAIEYAIMLALVIVVCMNIVSSLSRSTSGTFSRVNGTLS